MELYKREKVNPAAGCLPIVVQIPVFYALYKVLYVTIEMRHAPFFGWIRDLSAPDPTTFVNLFGLLPFTVPGWLDQFIHIGIWPLLMGFTMWFQMKLNPAPTDPMQQKIFAWMPVVFTYMLGSFASGLVIYWTWNNILSVAQQSYIMKKNGVEVPLMKNLGLDKLTSRLRPERKPAE
jgi:YidC/Oxa1 family membrane protein insertase